FEVVRVVGRGDGVDVGRHVSVLLAARGAAAARRGRSLPRLALALVLVALAALLEGLAEGLDGSGQGALGLAFRAALRGLADDVGELGGSLAAAFEVQAV